MGQDLLGGTGGSRAPAAVIKSLHATAKDPLCYKYDLEQTNKHFLQRKKEMMKNSCKIDSIKFAVKGMTRVEKT